MPILYYTFLRFNMKRENNVEEAVKVVKLPTATRKHDYMYKCKFD